MATEAAAYIVASDSELTGEDSPVVEVALGIDIGTSHSSMALWKNGGLHVLSSSTGSKRLPSYVIFTGDAPPSSGVTSAVHEPQLLSGAAIYNVKRLIGRMDTDPVVKACSDYSFLVQTLEIGIRPFIAALANGVWRSTTPEEVLGILLVELRAMAEAQLGRVVRSVVLTIPVSFSRFQQARLERACAMAGLHVLRLMPEPTAVALLYAQQQQQASQANMGSGMEKVALIFNIGAGYTDVAITSTAGGVSQIKALAGFSIGGEDLIRNVTRHLISLDMPHLKHGDDYRKLVGYLRFPVEKAIHALSSQTTALVEVAVSGMKISRTISRETFEHLNEDVFEKCASLVVECLNDAQIEADILADIILVGGCARIPRVRSLVQSACGGVSIYEGIDPLEAVVSGAALEGAIASGITDPSGNLDLLTIQAMPCSLGIRLSGSEFLPILHKNVTIPARRDIIVTTSNDNQKEALIVVYEGEGRRVEENHLLGFFKLSGIPLAPKGVPIITVCIDVDASDVMRVLAGVCMPDVEKPVLPLIEVRMPTVDDGHGWCTEAISKKYGSLLDVSHHARHASPAANA